jgi:hypothetical protein
MVSFCENLAVVMRVAMRIELIHKHLNESQALVELCINILKCGATGSFPKITGLYPIYSIQKCLSGHPRIPITNVLICSSVVRHVRLTLEVQDGQCFVLRRI